MNRTGVRRSVGLVLLAIRKANEIEIKNFPDARVYFSFGVNSAENICGQSRHADFRTVGEER